MADDETKKEETTAEETPVQDEDAQSARQMRLRLTSLPTAAQTSPPTPLPRSLPPRRPRG